MQIHPQNSERKRVYSLHHGRSRRPIVRILPDSAALYRIEWPDIGLSAPANLARCMEAAREWAELRFLTEHRKMNNARRLKSLDNFSWSASPVAPNEKDKQRTRPRAFSEPRAQNVPAAIGVAP